MLTPITYKEAADTLGVDAQRIRAAVHYETLTQVPGGKYTKSVYREQVELFKGKAELSKRLLSQEEKQAWEAIAAQANPVPAYQSVPSPAIHPPLPITINVTPPDGSALEYMHRTGTSLKAETPAGTMSFRSALPDEIDTGSVLQAMNNSGSLLAILVGLLILFFFMKQDKQKEPVRTQVRQTLAQIGIEKEDLGASQRKAISALESHPVETQKLRAILKREDLLPI